MRWKTPEDYDRINIRYIRRRRWRARVVYFGLAKAAALLIVATLAAFVIAHHFAWGIFPD
jgi:hypothetical protein